MKKTTVLFLLFTCSLASFAQKKFQLGLQVSPNLGWINPTSDNIENDGLRFGFNYGIVGDFNLTDNYSLSTGVLLVNTGIKTIRADQQEVSNTNGANTIAYGQTTADIRLKYIEIPLTLKLKTNEIGYMKYYGQFGFGLGFNYGATADEEFRYTSSNGSSGATLSREDVNYQDEIRLLRTSLVVGLGAEYNLSGSTSLVFGVTFNNGFLNIFSEDAYKEDVNGNALDPSNPNYTGKRDQDLTAINNYLLFNVGVLF